MTVICLMILFTTLKTPAFIILTGEWLTENISPVFKEGDRHLAVNYRPVFWTLCAAHY